MGLAEQNNEMSLHRVVSGRGGGGGQEKNRFCL